jgi:hypothetical protein
MEKSSKIENKCDIFMHEIKIEDEILSKFEKMGSLQT